jgi:hypothetical protein
VIEDLSNRGIAVHSIVGDGLRAQLSALSHSEPDSIQNSANWVQLAPFLRNIYYIYCSCQEVSKQVKIVITIGKSRIFVITYLHEFTLRWTHKGAIT